MTRALREYLEFERLMLILDEQGSPAVEALRDAMDSIWYRLGDDERRLLNERTIGRVTSLEEISLPAGEDLFGPPPAAPAPQRFPQGAITDWALVPA
jgi:hypothetical protein